MKNRLVQLTRHVGICAGGGVDLGSPLDWLKTFSSENGNSFALRTRFLATPAPAAIIASLGEMFENETKS